MPSPTRRRLALVLLAGALASTSLAGPAAAAGTSTATPLAGKVVFLDPGHNRFHVGDSKLVPAGGFTKACQTSGTATNAGYPEHTFSWAVAVKAAALLRAQGARVVLSRPDDNSSGPCVNQRAALANRVHADLAISIHADGGPAGGYGFHVIEPGLSPDRGNAAILAPSHRLALTLRSWFRTRTREPFATYVAHDGLARRSDLAGLNLARVPAVFVECGNMRNAGDAGRLITRYWQARAAAGIDQAVLAFLAPR